MSTAFLTSGGDSSGMNPAIKRFVEYGLECGEQPYLIYDGLEGLIDGDIHLGEWSDAIGLISRGGTILRSSRSDRFYKESFRQKAAENLRALGIDKLIMLGGDGSYRAMARLHQETGIAIACIPATIDNDVPGTDYSIGVDTALNVIRRAVDDIRDTAASFRRAFIVETMGRRCGYLAMISALVSGAEICLIPEVPYSLESIAKRLRKDIDRGRRYVLAIVSEGVEGGSSQLHQWFEEVLGMSSRVTVLGHIQRGGSPTVYDRRIAFEFATAALDGLLAGQTCFAVCSRGGQLASVPMESLPECPHVDAHLLELVQRLSH